MRNARQDLPAKAMKNCLKQQGVTRFAVGAAWNTWSPLLPVAIRIMSGGSGLCELRDWAVPQYKDQSEP